MLPLPSPPQMQGSFLRVSPRLLSSSLCTSFCRRISWSQVEQWSGSSSSSKATNFSPPLAASSDTPPPPSPVAPLPLPSPVPRIERFRQEDTEERFRSIGSRSEPSLPSIPGKFSKYSKPISKLHNEKSQKREERRDKKAFRKPMGDVAAKPDRNVVLRDGTSSATPDSSLEKLVRRNVSADDPVPVEKLPEWMQQYQFSYSEVPSAPIIGFRQTPWSPFGPADMVERPWTGCAPLKPSKKKLAAFDSFNPPPRGKKGVKYVQPPGPYPPGQGPKPAKSREEILGEPLTPLEIQELVNSVNKGKKQLNLGRDGLTHNMLDVIHSHWKRSVCCKIKCKGVPTIDMDNVAKAVEERTGGKIIHRAGGVMVVFRGRNYNYKDRPKIPVMLWKPPDPIYPRLIQPIPEGLTEQETKRLRGMGRKVAPLCRLCFDTSVNVSPAKNGVYMTLVAEVRAQLELDEVVRVDCQGMHPTDYKKIGAKLKDLVPCILLSFEKEQIIMCRKKPALIENVQPTQGSERAIEVSTDGDDSAGSRESSVVEESVVQLHNAEQNIVLAESSSPSNSLPRIADEDYNLEGAVSTTDEIFHEESLSRDGNLEGAVLDMDREGNSAASGTDVITEFATSATSRCGEDPIIVADKPMVSSSPISNLSKEETVSVREEVTARSTMNSMDDFEALWQRAIEEGKALQLDSQLADPDLVFEKAAELSGTFDGAISEDVSSDKEISEEERVSEEDKIGSRVPSTSPFDVPPVGGLRVDDLAKLLAP